MSNYNRNAHTVSTSESNDSSEVHRTARTGHTSYSSTARTLSEENEQSFIDRGQITSRFQRRVTLSPNPDEENQVFRLGTTLVSTLRGDGTTQRGDNVEWHDQDGRRPIDAGEYVNEITTLRYHPSQESLELSPPARSARRSMSVDRQQGFWGALNPRGIMMTTTTTTTTSRVGQDGQSVRYDPDILRWHEVESPVSTSSHQSRLTRSQQHTGQTSQRSRSHVGSSQNTSSAGIMGNDDNMIEEVIRTIHASRTQPFPGLSRGAGSDAGSDSGSDYDEGLLLSTGGYGGNSRIPRLNLSPNSSNQRSTEVESSSQDTNRSTFGRQMSSGQLNNSNMEGHSSLGEHHHRLVSHIPRPTTATSNSTEGVSRTVHTSNQQDTPNGQLGARKTSITRLPGPNIIDVPRRGSDSRSVSEASQGPPMPQDTTTQAYGIPNSQGSSNGTHALSTGRTDAQSRQGRAIEQAGFGVSHHPSKEAQDQSHGLHHSTTSVTDHAGIQDPRMTHTVAASKRNGQSTTAAHSNSTNGVGAGLRQGSGQTTQHTADNATQRATTPIGGHNATGILAAANKSRGGYNYPALNNKSAIMEKSQHSLHNNNVTGGGNAIYKTDSSNTQVRPVTGSTSSSPDMVPSHHHHDSRNTATTTTKTTATTSPGPQIPPATFHHGNHAIFNNLSESEKAGHHQTHSSYSQNRNSYNNSNNNQQRGLGFRFREASLSTVGSIFKPERRQSSVTMLGTDGDGYHDNRDNHHHQQQHSASDTGRYRDEAWEFLLRYRTERIVVMSREGSYLRRLRWRIDLHLMILFFLVVLLTYCDKILFNYARVMGLLTELHITTNSFANASSYFYVASLGFSLPNIWLLSKFPLAKLLAINLIGWGICTATHAALRNYGGLVTVRVLSGMFEAGVLPALILLTAQYFTLREQPIRFAYWSSGMAVGQMLSGLLSWAFQHMSPRDHLSSWKTMYLLLGLLTVIVGFLILFFVPDTPIKARFLNNEEKVALLEHIKVNKTGIGNRRFQPRQVVEGMFDLGCWLLGIIVVLQLISAGVTMFYSVSLFTGFGYSAERSALLNMPSGAINLVCMFLYAIFVRYCGMRWLVVCFAGIISTVGAALLFGLTVYSENRRALLAGIYLINFAPGATMIVFYWMSCNVAGHTKRAYAMAALNAAYALGAIIGPQTFRHQVVPGYRSAKLTLVITMAVTVALAPLAAGYFWYMNRKRDRKYQRSQYDEDVLDDSTAYGGLTDKKNKSFRYRT